MEVLTFNAYGAELSLLLSSNHLDTSLECIEENKTPPGKSGETQFADLVSNISPSNSNQHQLDMLRHIHYS